MPGSPSTNMTKKIRPATVLRHDRHVATMQMQMFYADTYGLTFLEKIESKLSEHRLKFSILQSGQMTGNLQVSMPARKHTKIILYISYIS